MINKISATFYRALSYRSYCSFAKFIVNNPTTGKPCAEFPNTDTEADMKK